MDKPGITMLDVAKARGVKVDPDGSINGAEFERVRIPLFGGCSLCEASLGVFNAFPDRCGYWRCRECLEQPFRTVEDFEQTYSAEDARRRHYG